MKAAWDPVTLTALFWVGDPAVAGDELKTRTGRRYQILAIRGNKLDCMVLPKDAPVQGRVFNWTWGKRK